MNSSDKKTHKAYRRLVALINENGDKYPKKHGSWIRIRLYSDFWLVMDSWNNSIKVTKGECKYDNQFTGFANYKEIDYLGIDFGRFECHVDGNRLNYYHELARLA